MPEENELNNELPSKLSEIESVLLGVELPESVIDQNVLMYQAGWSAAMAEISLSSETSPSRPSRKSETVWSAIAMSLAASTAVCLILLLGGPEESSSSESEIAQVEEVEVVETKIEPSDDSVTIARNAPETPDGSVGVNSASPSVLGRLFKISTIQFVRQRDDQIQKLLAETTSPSQGLVTVDNDEDIEPWIPFTFQSPVSSSL